jgi:hypothetical protein
VWTGALEELGAAPVPSAAADAPGTLVVGDVVAIREALVAETAEVELPSAAAGGTARRQSWQR